MIARRGRGGWARAALGAITAVALLVPASGAPVASAAPSAAPGAAWTVMLYVDADNNLDIGLLDQIKDAAEVRYGGAANLVVLIDRSQEAGEAEPLMNVGTFTGAKLLQVGEGELTELQDLGEIDMGNPRTLAWFLQESARRFPAEHYSLSVIDHGGAWQGISWDDDAPDDERGDPSNLTMADLSTGLQQGLQAAGIDRLDVLNLSACLMGSYEVASEVQPFARYLVAAEEISLSYLFDMRTIMGELQSGGVTPEQLAVDFVDTYDANSTTYGGKEEQSFAALDLDQVPRLRTQVDGLFQAIGDDLEASALPLASARADALTFGALGIPGVENPFAQVDLGDLLLRLQSGSPKPPDDVLRWAAAVREQLARTLVHQVTGVSTASATGLSLYFPVSADAGGGPYDHYATDVHAGSWPKLLDAVHEQLATRAKAAGELRFAADPTLAETDGGLTLSAPIDDETRSLLTDAKFQVSVGIEGGARRGCCCSSQRSSARGPSARGGTSRASPWTPRRARWWPPPS
ncbi:hypothetical protein KSP35_13465 [Aquihabitans sp. G128]|uniref:clostripain-related cysteine peptidase n=1 Tax=Aquihabitans sp. G128 TaxID=2849779 RepID=UPI001C23D302|nr:clostripain-related cysteine peptidase [Aquihabitans sp. G128]QXC59408.1 hypothetical protein KSP35_13465 [Aquihabitans sp. G128]